MTSYLITDPAEYGSDPEAFAMRLGEVFARHHPDLACYRDKAASAGHYAAMAERFLLAARAYGVPVALLHGDSMLAAKLGAQGVHLTSGQLGEIHAAKALGLYVIVSTHSEAEMLEAQRLGADAVTYSPVYRSPGKGNPKGLEDLKERVAKIGITVFALGGIVTPVQVKEVESTGCTGFASIRYFTDN